MAGAPTGGMDQAIALFAAPDTALLLDFGADTQTPVSLPLPGSGVTLLVVNTGVSHALTDGSYGDRRAECDRAASLLGVPTLSAAPGWEALSDDVLVRRTRHILTENDRVRSVVASLGTGDWAAVGVPSSPRTPRCATTSRSAATSSTWPWTPPSRPARSAPG